MHKLIFPTILLSLMLTVACSSLKSDLLKPDPFPKDAAVPPDFAVTLKRTACFGTCPIYTLTIKADGSVVFEGEKFTATTGKAEAKISEAKIRELIKAFEEADYFGFDDSYGYDSSNCPSTATDMPTVTTSIQINNRKKSIDHYLGCTDGTEGFNIYPAKLYQLENKIDEIVGTKRWIGEQK
jgi:hypothetical protein